jgi:hypothetical protein
VSTDFEDVNNQPINAVTFFYYRPGGRPGQGQMGKLHQYQRTGGRVIAGGLAMFGQSIPGQMCKVFYTTVKILFTSLYTLCSRNPFGLLAEGL